MQNFHPALHYPRFGTEIACPHCQRLIPALVLTDTYICPRHGAFEVDIDTQELVHLQSNRRWQMWEQKWYRQHTHPDGIRAEIHESLDQMYKQGYRVTKVMIAQRYAKIVGSYLDSSSDRHTLQLFGLLIEFSPSAKDEPRWQVINFDLTKEPGIPALYHFRLS
jgi:uncharacterized protein (TIGR02652 family)